jgi:4-amino-4-deoxy-L-arabinose transferase-like glycosyltransferase
MGTGRMTTFLRRYWWPLAIVTILLLAAAVRVWLLARSNWLIEGDEATMAIVGIHILREHERPIYFPGQAYMGAWQSYLAALSFWLFDISRPAAKLVPLLSSLAWIGTTILLARRIYSRQAALLAGLFAAVPSLYFISTTLRIAYPLIDVLALGNLILYLAIDAVWREEPPRRFPLRFLVLGIIAGFGFYLHSAMAMFVAPAALILLLRWPRPSIFPGAPLAIVGFVLGALPVFNHARQHEYTLFHYLRGNPEDTAARTFPDGYQQIGNHLVEHLLPRYLGASVPWQGAHPLLQLAIGLPTVVAIGWAIWRCRRAPLAWFQRHPERSSPESVILLFAAVVLVTYVLSRFSVYAIMFPNVDATGRYVAPLGAAIPLLLAGTIWRLSRLHQRAVVATIALTLLLLGGTVANYARSDPYQPFQSPYYRTLPPNSDQLIAALNGMNVDAVWIDHWAGKPLMFDTADRIAAADYLDLRVWLGIDRLKSATTRVFADDSPAFVFVTSLPRVPLEDTLDERAVPYEATTAGDYRVVHPLEPVDPATVVDELLAGR